MRLDKDSSIFNLGDTSIRVQQLVEVNKLILEQVNLTITDEIIWEKNKTLQQQFYDSFIDEVRRREKQEGIELFADFKRLKNSKTPTSKLGMRGRTLTNAVVKTGLITKDRHVSLIGRAYLDGNLAKKDKVEEILNLSEDNLVYFRQLLKLRIYEPKGNKYFYCFRFALLFLSQYKDVPQQYFLKIIESIRPSQSEYEVRNIINEYKNVTDGKEEFDCFYKRMFLNTVIPEGPISELEGKVGETVLSDESFSMYFHNQDSRDTTLIYKDFVLNLLRFSDTPTKAILDRIIRLAKMDKIKKAFGGGKIPFKIKNNMGVSEFRIMNINNPLLSGRITDIHTQFVFSKHDDLIREYSDMCRRVFQVTGVISFDNGLANLNSAWIIRPLLECLEEQFSLTGEESVEDYENQEDSLWYANVSSKDVLAITDDDIYNIYEVIRQENDIDNVSDIGKLVTERTEAEYRSFIASHFPIEKVIQVLRYICERKDDKVFDLVTRNATIPTIYEYIITIAWYYLSERKSFRIHKTFQVSLDGNKLPLTHRGGGAGDIEIIDEGYQILIEATLMNMNTQKRGELEPVIRHSVKFSLDHGQNTRTIFVANELDDNVINIFRAMQFVQLNGTTRVGNVLGVKIFALTTYEIIRFLERRISDIEIISVIQEHDSINAHCVFNKWREDIVEEILSK